MRPCLFPTLMPSLLSVYPSPRSLLRTPFISRVEPSFINSGNGDLTSTLITLSFLTPFTLFFNNLFLTAPRRSANAPYSAPRLFSRSSLSLLARAGLFPEVALFVPLFFMPYLLFIRKLLESLRDPRAYYGYPRPGPEKPKDLPLGDLSAAYYNAVLVSYVEEQGIV